VRGENSVEQSGGRKSFSVGSGGGMWEKGREG